jgi:PTH2 family peptidyl-tRNA hydrolase
MSIHVVPFNYAGQVQKVGVCRELDQTCLFALLGSAFGINPSKIVALHRGGAEVPMKAIVEKEGAVDIIVGQVGGVAKMASSTMHCSAGHALTLFQTPHKGFCCDNCGNTVKKGANMHGCRKCDFDLCTACVNLAAEIGEEEFFRQMQEEDEEDEDEDDENWYIEGQDMPPPKPDEELKMVLCVRSDLKMGKGKLAAQCCHAAVACFHQSAVRQPVVTRQYEWYGAAKVALKANDEETIRKIFDAARAADLVTYLVADAGRTQIASGKHHLHHSLQHNENTHCALCFVGTRTVCGVGPAPKSEIDKLTGPNGMFPLKLL